MDPRTEQVAASKAGPQRDSATAHLPVGLFGSDTVLTVSALHGARLINTWRAAVELATASAIGARINKAAADRVRELASTASGAVTAFTAQTRVARKMNVGIDIYGRFDQKSECTDLGGRKTIIEAVASC